MIVCNLFGGPGAGKSTLAAALFAELKRRSVNAELATEYAKDKFWEGALDAMAKYPIYFFAKQHHRIARLDGQVAVAITDSPFVMGLLYQGGSPELRALAAAEQKRWKSVNVFVHRPSTYQMIGRGQSIDESRQLDLDIKSLLTDHQILYWDFVTETGNVADLANYVIYELENQ